MSVAAALEGFIHIPVRWSIRGRLQGSQGKVGIAETSFVEFVAMVEEQSATALNQSSDGSIGEDELVMYKAGRIELDGRTITLNDVVVINGLDYKVLSARYRIEGDYSKVTVKRTSRAGTTAPPPPGP